MVTSVRVPPKLPPVRPKAISRRVRESCRESVAAVSSRWRSSTVRSRPYTTGGCASTPGTVASTWPGVDASRVTRGPLTHDGDQLTSPAPESPNARAGAHCVDGPMVTGADQGGAAAAGDGSRQGHQQGKRERTAHRD